ncbi:MAG: hypothetical protein Q8Q60_01255 [Candidatus Chromulinivorax sp.]|nr:hypothetical protein [Candidatus Chromulinivorax sp.]
MKYAQKILITCFCLISIAQGSHEGSFLRSASTDTFIEEFDGQLSPRSNTSTPEPNLITQRAVRIQLDEEDTFVRPYTCPSCIKYPIQKIKGTANYLCFQPCRNFDQNYMKPFCIQCCNTPVCEFCDPIAMYLGGGRYNQQAHNERCKQCIQNYGMPCLKTFNKISDIVCYTICCCWACE